MECEEADVLKKYFIFLWGEKMINSMVCDLFMFLKVKKNPEVNCLFHTETNIRIYTGI